jgi:hypothetical protein
MRQLNDGGKLIPDKILCLKDDTLSLKNRIYFGRVRRILRSPVLPFKKAPGRHRE